MSPPHVSALQLRGLSGLEVMGLIPVGDLTCLSYQFFLTSAKTRCKIATPQMVLRCVVLISVYILCIVSYYLLECVACIVLLFIWIFFGLCIFKVFAVRTGELVSKSKHLVQFVAESQSYLSRFVGSPSIALQM